MPDNTEQKIAQLQRKIEQQQHKIDELTASMEGHRHPDSIQRKIDKELENLAKLQAELAELQG